MVAGDLAITGKTSATGGLNIGSSAGTAAPSGGVNGDVYFQIGTTTFQTEILNLIYPVGAIYRSVSNTSPATLFGGTWKQIGTQETLSVTGTKVVTSSTYDYNMHTIDQIKKLFYDQYGYEPTFVGTVTTNQATYNGLTVGDTYTDLGVAYYNGHWEAAYVTMAPIKTSAGQFAARMSSSGTTVRINYLYTTHRQMYQWQRTA